MVIISLLHDVHTHRTIDVFNPGNNFPSVSITGTKCDLSCAHCGGQYLKHMFAADTPTKLIKLCFELSKNKVKGVLISGGCNNAGAVMQDEYLDAISIIKQKTNLILNVHTGLVSKSQANALAKTCVDVVSFDVIGDKRTIHEVYGLDNTPEDFKNSLLSLKRAGIKKIVPHICAGLFDPAPVLSHERTQGHRNPLYLAPLP